MLTKSFSHWPLAAGSLIAGALGAQLLVVPLVGQLPGVPLPAPQPQVAPPPGELYSYRDIVKRALPAVVTIEVRAATAKANPTPRRLPPNLPDEYRKYFESAPRPRPETDPDLGNGSGVLVDVSGIVLTNYHVVEGADEVEVILQDGRSFRSKDIRRDPKTDLAIVVLKVEQPLPFLPLGDSGQMEVGDRVLAVGAPFGLTGSVSQGIISAKSRQGLNLNQYEDFLQTDAAVNPGNSGGPLINLNAEVIGINAAIKTRSGGFQGVGLAVSSNLARDVVEQLRTNGIVRRGFLGIGIREIDETLAARLRIPKTTGVVISRIYPDSPATKAGLKVGDIITSVAGVPINDLPTLPNVVAKHPINKPAQVSYLREGQRFTVPVLVIEQPEEVARSGRESASPPALPGAAPLQPVGLTVAELTEATALQLGYPRTARGVLITAIDRDSPAAKLGLLRNMVIVKVDRTLTPTPREFAAALAAANPERGALLHLLKTDGEIEFRVLPLPTR